MCHRDIGYVYRPDLVGARDLQVAKQVWLDVGRLPRLAPAYDLLNTSRHVRGDDFGLDGGLSPNILISDAYANTGHPCRLDFERFGECIGLVKSRMGRILDKYMQFPESAVNLVGRSFLNDKMKRYYLRIVNERIARFTRESD